MNWQATKALREIINNEYGDYDEVEELLIEEPEVTITYHADRDELWFTCPDIHKIIKVSIGLLGGEQDDEY